jgi:hypothetical protein
MATVILNGYFALGTGFGAGYTFTEVSGGSYARIIVNNSGTYQTGTTQTITTFAAATAPAGLPMRIGAIFDVLTGGNMLAWWEMTAPLTAVGTALPSTVFNMTLSGNVIAGLLNVGEVFAAGSQIGLMNSQPLIAGVNLIGSSVTTGQLTFEPAVGTIVTNPLFMNQGVPVGRFDASGNFIIKGTVSTGATV